MLLPLLRRNNNEDNLLWANISESIDAFLRDIHSFSLIKNSLYIATYTETVRYTIEFFLKHLREETMQLHQRDPRWSFQSSS